MMKKSTVFFALICFLALSAQEKKSNYQQQREEISEARKIIEDAQTTRINKDWSLIASFRSGIGETAEFFPVQIVNLKNGVKHNAMQVELEIKRQGMAKMMMGAMAGNAAALINDGKITAWVGKDEVNEMINFIEQEILPNINLKFRDKSSEFVFNAKEITLKFLVHENRKRLTIILNQYDELEFWTESRAEKIGDLLPILKKVQSKELEF